MEKMTTSSPIAVYDRMIVSGRLAVRRQWQMFKGALIIVDVLCVMAALMLAYKVRLDGFLLGLQYEHHIDPDMYRWTVAASAPIFVVAAALLGLYRRDNLLGGVVEYKQIIKACTATILAIILTTFWIRDDNFDLSRLWIALAWVFLIVVAMGARFAVRRVGYWLRELGYLFARVLIVGANDQGAAIAHQWCASPRSGMRVVGFLDDFKSVGSKVVGDLAVVGRPTALSAAVHEYQIDEVVVVSSAVAWETFGELVTRNQQATDFAMRLSPGFYELLTSSMAVINKSFVPLLTLHESRIVGVDAFLKWLFDAGMTGIALLLTWPVGVAIALRLRRKHPGQPVFSQQRVCGLLGKPFDLLSFATYGAEHEHADNITRPTLESWLVWTGFDKWPQLINVLRGELSLVGPRPLPIETRVDALRGAHNLASVKPGVLGPWLINDAWRSPNLLNDEVAYVRNWEIWRDVPIVLCALQQHAGRLVKFAPIAADDAPGAREGVLR
jgi:lipopolysaccharide/colanic/teichoic acid biosynthesis glycosyltransferase